MVSRGEGRGVVVRERNGGGKSCFLLLWILTGHNKSDIKIKNTSLE